MEKRKITVTCEIEVVKMSELIEHLKAAEQKSEVKAFSMNSLIQKLSSHILDI
jgi:hypothetical protein